MVNLCVNPGRRKIKPLLLTPRMHSLHIGSTTILSVLILAPVLLHAYVCSRPNIRQGDRGEHVRHAQRQLLRVGNRAQKGTPAYHIRTSGGADGIFGRGTRAAVLSYQRIVFQYTPQEQDGIIGPRTWRMIGCNAKQRPVASGSRGQHQNANAVAYWDFPSEFKWRVHNMRQVMTIRKKGPKSFWALQWTWTTAKNGGYIGLQTSGDRQDGTFGETAVFSLWDANRAQAAPGATCERFGGEGVGFSCRRAFRIREKVKYRYFLKRLHADLSGQWWGGWIQIGKVSIPLGRIRVNRRHRFVNNILTFSEYYGIITPCGRVPTSKQFVFRVRGNGDSLTAKYGQGGVGDCSSGKSLQQDGGRSAVLNLGV